MNTLIIRSISKANLVIKSTKFSPLVLNRQFNSSLKFLNKQKDIKSIEKIEIKPIVKKSEVGVNPPIVPINDGNKKIESEPINPKKKFSFTWFLIKYGFYAGVLYTGFLFVATKSDTVMDFVIDQQLPLSEEIIDILENGSLDDLNKKIQGSVDKIKSFSFQLPSTDDISSKSEKFIEDTKQRISEVTASVPRPTHGSKSSSSSSTSSASNDKITAGNATPAQQLQKPVETVQKTFNLPLIKSSSVDESVKATIDSFNDLIKSIDVHSANISSKDALIKVINENVSKLTKKIDSLTSKFDDSLANKLKDSHNELLSNFTKKELELTEDLLDQLNSEKNKLEQKLNERLINEINVTKETINQAAINAVSMMRIEQTKKFEKLIKTKLDNERNGRLANLEKLNDRLNELEEFSISLENQLTSNHNKILLSKSISNLKHTLSIDIDNNKKLSEYFVKIDEISKSINDELINLTVKDLKPLLVDSNILTNRQLFNKWEQLTPELRSSSLLPPNAGLLGHLTSMIFSKLLLPVKGNNPNGKDIESVIGRIESNLSRGELDLAVEEAANLKGWPRKLADDWVKEGRKRLEVQFLIDILESESRIV